MNLESLFGKPTYVVEKAGTPDYGTVLVRGREMNVIAIQRHSDGTESLLLENNVVLPGRVVNMIKTESN